MSVFEVIGFAGIAISLLAYVPQVTHLVREHCSDGVSGRAWAMWIVSGLLIGTVAIHHRDPVFIILQASSLTSTAVIVFLSHRYRGRVCEAHAHLASPAQVSRKSEPDDSNLVVGSGLTALPLWEGGTTARAEKLSGNA